MTSSAPITVLLAEDHMVVREGLRRLLEDENDISVVGEATSGHQAVNMAKELRPDVIIMDIAMPKLNGIDSSSPVRKTSGILPSSCEYRHIEEAGCGLEN